MADIAIRERALVAAPPGIARVRGPGYLTADGDFIIAVRGPAAWGAAWSTGLAHRFHPGTKQDVILDMKVVAARFEGITTWYLPVRVGYALF